MKLTVESLAVVLLCGSACSSSVGEPDQHLSIQSLYMMDAELRLGNVGKTLFY